MVGRGTAPRGRRTRTSAVPRARDRRAVGRRRTRVAGGRPRRGPRHHPCGHSRRPRRGRGRARHGRRRQADPRGDLEGRLPPPGGSRHAADRRLPRALPAPGGALRAMDLGAARRRRDDDRGRLPSPVPHLVARGDGDRHPGRLRDGMAAPRPPGHLRVRRPDRRRARSRVGASPARRAPMVGARSGRRPRRLDDRRSAPRMGPATSVHHDARSGSHRVGDDLRRSHHRSGDADRRPRRRRRRHRLLPRGPGREHPSCRGRARASTGPVRLRRTCDGLLRREADQAREPRVRSALEAHAREYPGRPRSSRPRAPPVLPGLRRGGSPSSARVHRRDLGIRRRDDPLPMGRISRGVFPGVRPTRRRSFSRRCRYWLCSRCSVSGSPWWSSTIS